MPKTSATPKSKGRARARKRHPHIPLQLRTLAKLLNQGDEKKLLGEALTAAKQVLSDLGEYPDAIHDFIGRSAETGPYKKGVARAIAVDPGNIDGDLHNAYGIPGLLAGIAFAYVFLNDGGA
jgi:hypothetical protein